MASEWKNIVVVKDTGGNGDYIIQDLEGTASSIADIDGGPLSVDTVNGGGLPNMAGSADVPANNYPIKSESDVLSVAGHSSYETQTHLAAIIGNNELGQCPFVLNGPGLPGGAPNYSTISDIFNVTNPCILQESDFTIASEDTWTVNDTFIYYSTESDVDVDTSPPQGWNYSSADGEMEVDADIINMNVNGTPASANGDGIEINIPTSTSGEVYDLAVTGSNWDNQMYFGDVLKQYWTIQHSQNYGNPEAGMTALIAAGVHSGGNDVVNFSNVGDITPYTQGTSQYGTTYGNLEFVYPKINDGIQDGEVTLYPAPQYKLDGNDLVGNTLSGCLFTTGSGTTIYPGQTVSIDDAGGIKMFNTLTMDACTITGENFVYDSTNNIIYLNAGTNNSGLSNADVREALLSFLFADLATYQFTNWIVSPQDFFTNSMFERGFVLKYIPAEQKFHGIKYTPDSNDDQWYFQDDWDHNAGVGSSSAGYEEHKKKTIISTNYFSGSDPRSVDGVGSPTLPVGSLVPFEKTTNNHLIGIKVNT